MAAVWYYKLMDELHGPFTASQLREKAVAGNITHDAWIRKGQYGKWTTADRVSGLFASKPSRSEDATTAKPTHVDSPVSQSLSPAGAHSSDSSTSPPEGTTTKICPFCAEEIAIAARKCKHCGEFLDGTTQSRVSQENSGNSSGPEITIWEEHPSSYVYLAYWILGVLLLPFFGIGLVLIIYAILDQKTKVFTLTNKRVMSKAGIISRSTCEVTLSDIRNINMQQSVLERIFGLGTVQIGSAGTAGIEVVFSGIVNPAEVRDQIRQSKDQPS